MFISLCTRGRLTDTTQLGVLGPKTWHTPIARPSLQGGVILEGHNTRLDELGCATHW
ncbi:MAG: hypothetical protein R3C68_17905 [Myxococcota bacterium]